MVAQVTRDGRTCQHLSQHIDLTKQQAKLQSSEPTIKCEDCRFSTRIAKNQATSRSVSKGIWICTECGHFLCGGIRRQLTRFTHVVRHAKVYNHHLALSCEDPRPLWCVTCKMDVTRKNVALSRKPNVAEKPEESESAGGPAHRNRKYSVKGFKNLGFTCYLNSVMQNLLALDCVRDHYAEMENCTGTLSKALKGLIQETENDSVVLIDTALLLKRIRKLYVAFESGLQQDSHECLTFLLNTLVEEEGVNTSTEDRDRLETIIGGELSNIYTCMGCKGKSWKKDAFYMISVPYSKPEGSSGSSDNAASLKSCFASFLAPQTVEQQCTDCGENRAEGVTLIHKLRRVLIIHINRFELRNQEWKKIDDHVKFEELLDLNPFMEQGRGLYQLVGVLEHFGKSMNEGHYISYLKGAEGTGWYRANDTEVDQVDLDKIVLKSKAYMLFYQVANGEEA